MENQPEIASSVTLKPDETGKQLLADIVIVGALLIEQGAIALCFAMAEWNVAASSALR